MLLPVLDYGQIFVGNFESERGWHLGVHYFVPFYSESFFLLKKVILGSFIRQGVGCCLRKVTT